MHKMIFQKTAGSLLLAAGLIAAPLSANAYTTDGVTFTFSQTAIDELTLQVDASHHADLTTYSWYSATNIGAIGIKDVGTFTGVSLLGDTGTSAFTSWSHNSGELSASDICSDDKGGVNRVCAWADLGATPAQSRVGPLTDNMLFHFKFSGGVQDFSDPHLKIQFYNGDGALKVGDQLSLNIPLVPEPNTWAMFVLGLGILGFLARPKRI